ncbi:unnamed protein product [Vitrella brassicaformis CCMP3155]|uniref:Amine oxidase domain-containing protein n=1 Tax=Vitrella brassicaformis (strain CCMP3155) TaxID=1169540 RepID=A0A0G4F8G1_VITBC|nr:unnamed protein product [Vitrella brassicaformis CCMP3155]|eukprot:CEM08832.1 unnamed protein product [Vitrella brassicaformis CCMP3155]
MDVPPISSEQAAQEATGEAAADRTVEPTHQPPAAITTSSSYDLINSSGSAAAPVANTSNHQPSPCQQSHRAPCTCPPSDRPTRRPREDEGAADEAAVVASMTTALATPEISPPVPQFRPEDAPGAVNMRETTDREQTEQQEDLPYDDPAYATGWIAVSRPQRGCHKTPPTKHHSSGGDSDPGERGGRGGHGDEDGDGELLPSRKRGRSPPAPAACKPSGKRQGSPPREPMSCQNDDVLNFMAGLDRQGIDVPPLVRGGGGDGGVDAHFIVVGAGVAGLTAAAMLKRRGYRVIVLEGRDRVGGRIHTKTLPAKDSLPETKVDLGANWLHVAPGDPHYPWDLAAALGIETSAVMGGKWEPTEFANWYDEQGRQIPQAVIIKALLLIERAMAHMVAQKHKEDQATTSPGPFPAHMAALPPFPPSGSSSFQDWFGIALNHALNDEAQAREEQRRADERKRNRRKTSRAREQAASLAADQAERDERELALIRQMGSKIAQRMFGYNCSLADLALLPSLAQLGELRLPDGPHRLVDEGRLKVRVSADTAYMKSYQRGQGFLPIPTPPLSLYDGQHHAPVGQAGGSAASSSSSDGFMGMDVEGLEAYSTLDLFKLTGDDIARLRGDTGERGEGEDDGDGGQDDGDSEAVTPSSKRRKTSGSGWRVREKKRREKRAKAGSYDPFKNSNLDHKLTIGDRLNTRGYSWLPDLLVQSADLQDNISLNTAVNRVCIVEGSHHVEVTTEAGEVYSALKAVVTVPVGVLNPSNTSRSRIVFDPPLSEAKREACGRLGGGGHNKVILRFKECFWDETAQFLNTPDESVQFMNLHAFDPTKATNTLVGHLFGHFNVNREQTVTKALEVLSTMATNDTRLSVSSLRSLLVDVEVTQWDTDVFSLGSYSYYRPGGSLEHIEELATAHPEPDSKNGVDTRPAVFFAGEATSVSGNQCVHGAVHSGVRATTEALAAVHGVAHPMWVASEVRGDDAMEEE